MNHRLLIIAALLLPGLASAASWRSEPDSSLRFEGAAQGESFIGTFRQFSALVEFDPAAPATARIEADIDLASADSQNAERDELLGDAAFFALHDSHRARFVSVGAVADGAGYLARGTLTLKGVSRAVNFRFRFTQDGATARLEGEALLDRTEFGVGSGEWEDAEMIAHEVRVMTTLQLAPAAAAP